jgi:CarD family transcriptional regulator
MYSVGDKVVHPGYGPGVITNVERRQVIGEAKRYYVIDMLSGGTILMTPVAQADKIGLRLAIDDVTIDQLLGMLAEPPNSLSPDFRERQEAIEERLREADIFVTTEVLRDMAWYGQARGLTKRDTQLMQRAEESVAGEIALIRDIEIQEAAENLQAILAQAFRDQEEEDPPTG